VRWVLIEGGEPTSVEVSLFLLVSNQELLLRVEAFGNVLENGIALPDDFVIVGVVDEGGDTAIWVEFAIFLCLVFLFGKVKDDLTGSSTSAVMRGNGRGNGD
jgi:hypothetical protein